MEFNFQGPTEHSWEKEIKMSGITYQLMVYYGLNHGEIRLESPTNGVFEARADKIQGNLNGYLEKGILPDDISFWEISCDPK